MLRIEGSIQIERSPDRKIFWAIGALVFLPAWFLMKSQSVLFGPFVGVGLVGYLLLSISYKRRWVAARLAYLRSKYKDERVVQAVFAQKYWQGQTAEQLLDSLGNPVAIDDKLLKTRTREVWKYERQGVNRYRLRITLDNDEVVAWNRNSML